MNYNRSANNIWGTRLTSVNATPLLIAEFGLFVSQPENFVELIATIGWSGIPIPSGGDQAEVEFVITQDNIRVVSTQEEPPGDTSGGDADIFQTTTFQGVLTNIPTGHHVYRLFITNLDTTQSDIFVLGPVTMSGKVIAP